MSSAEGFMKAHEKVLRGALFWQVRRLEGRLMKLAAEVPGDRFPEQKLDVLTDAFQRNLGETCAAVADFDLLFPPGETLTEEQWAVVKLADELFGDEGLDR